MTEYGQRRAEGGVRFLALGTARSEIVDQEKDAFHLLPLMSFFL